MRLKDTFCLRRVNQRMGQEWGLVWKDGADAFQRINAGTGALTGKRDKPLKGIGTELIQK